MQKHRFGVAWRIVPSSLLIGALGSSCSNRADDCDYTKSCGSGATGRGGSGTSGSAGTASGGRSGNAGAAGSSGTAGDDAGSGRGGSAGSADGGSAGRSGGSSGGDAGDGAEGGEAGVTGSGGSGGSGGAAGDGGAGGGEPECDVTKTPSEDSCVIDEELGVFVSPEGDDESGDGSRADPYATLGKALGEAGTSAKRVYACADAGSFVESVALGAGANGIGMFGGFSCDDWSYDAESRSVVASPGTVALRVEGVEALVIDGFAFEAAAATEPGGSSVGALLVASEGIVMRRVRIEAGAGMAGADGELRGFTYPEQAELDGNAASGSSQEVGGAEQVYMCPGGAVTTGGKGGTAPSEAGGNGTPDWGGGKGGAALLTCATGGTGFDGAHAPVAERGMGAAGLGELSALGWAPASGASGQNGAPGQGGGGGASSTARGGGSGGAGSCGGAGGPGGNGGGASIAVMVFESEILLERFELVASDAGKGGDGDAGQPRQGVPGAPGDGGGGIGACDGGTGGLGADGGTGGGGAGGISVGILWKGQSAPVTLMPSITVGAAGQKGIGGEPGLNDGVVGVSENVLEVQ